MFFHEPVAAAVDYLTAQSEPFAVGETYNLLVFDFGGGTTDFALIEIEEEINSKRVRIVMPRVLAVDGDPALGGEDVTDMLMELYKSKIESLNITDNNGKNIGSFVLTA